MDHDKKRLWERAGWWNAVGVGLLAAGLPIVLANNPALGWTLVIAALATFIVAATVLRRPKSVEVPIRLPPKLSVPPSIGLAPDKEINMQEAFELIVERLGIPMHGHDTKSTDARLTIFHDLRQKARDGTITIRGREQPFGAHGGIFKPRENIPPEHWKNMDFDSVRYIFATEHQTIVEAATDPDDDNRRDNPTPYVDLTVSQASIEKEWPQVPMGSSHMISAKEFLAASEKHGWRFDSKSVDVNRLQVGLREAAANGRVNVYGRKYTSVPSITRNEPRVVVPAELWKTHWLILLSVLPPMNGENFETAAQVPTEKPTYVDIHFGVEVLDWLKSEAEQYRHVKF